MIDVTFFPRRDLPTRICNYKHGKRFAIQLNTDSGLNPYAGFQLFQSFKYGLKYTMFSNRYNPGGGASISNIDYINHVGTGLVELQHYFSTDRWVNPVTLSDEIIPDHYETSWTSLGANAFGAIVGESKQRLYPNHGQELFDLTDGLYGFDVINGNIGASNLSELFGIKENHNKWVDSLELDRSTVFSYRNGRNITPDVYKLLYLSGRQSTRDINYFYYGKSKEDNRALGNDLDLSRTNIINQPITTRWVDSAISTSQGALERANQQLRDKIDQAYENEGVEYDFSHDHSAGTNELLEYKHKTIGEYLDLKGYRNSCWVAGYGELMQYFWFRELTKRAVATMVRSKVYITLEWSNLKTAQNFISDGLFLEMLKVPLSIEIDLTGTSLAGKNITSTGRNILALGNNRYIVEFPFQDAVEGLKSIVLYEGEGKLYDQSNILVSTSLIGNELSINVNKPVKAVCFSTSTDIYSIVPVLFSNSFQRKHVFNIDLAKSNTIGVIDELGNTKLMAI